MQPAATKAASKCSLQRRRPNLKSAGDPLRIGHQRLTYLAFVANQVSAWLSTVAVAKAASKDHDEIVRLLAHCGARLTFQDGSGDGFWTCYQDDAKRNRMHDFWTSIINAGGDAPTEESLRIRRKMMIKAKMFDPRE